jgi:hypothetical protein
MRFLPLLTLEINSSYYSGICEDFDFVPTAETLQYFKEGRLLTRLQNGRLFLLFEVDEAGEPIISLIDQTLSIGLKLMNPLFLNFTGLNFDPESMLSVYKNTDNPAALDAPIQAQRVSFSFLHPISHSTRPVSIELISSGGQTLFTEALTTSQQTAVRFDLSDYPAGIYQVVATHPDRADTTQYYVNDTFFRESILGVVEITIDSAFYTAPPSFSLSFSSKNQSLEYYIVANQYSEAEFDQLTVLDAGFTEESRDEINFSRVLPADFTTTELDPALLGPDTAQIALFRSQVPLPRQALGRKKIQLHKNGDVLIPHLPQPGAGAANSTLIVQVSKR